MHISYYFCEFNDMKFDTKLSQQQLVVPDLTLQNHEKQFSRKIQQHHGKS